LLVVLNFSTEKNNPPRRFHEYGKWSGSARAKNSEFSRNGFSLNDISYMRKAVLIAEMINFGVTKALIMRRYRKP